MDFLIKVSQKKYFALFFLSLQGKELTENLCAVIIGMGLNYDNSFL